MDCYSDDLLEYKEKHNPPLINKLLYDYESLGQIILIYMHYST
jgi:hypothetical protein